MMKGPLSAVLVLLITSLLGSMPAAAQSPMSPFAHGMMMPQGPGYAPPMPMPMPYPHAMMPSAPGYFAPPAYYPQMPMMLPGQGYFAPMAPMGSMVWQGRPMTGMQAQQGSADMRRQDWTDRARIMRGMVNSISDEDLGRVMEGMFERWRRAGRDGAWHHRGHGHDGHRGRAHRAHRERGHEGHGRHRPDGERQGRRDQHRRGASMQSWREMWEPGGESRGERRGDDRRSGQAQRRGGDSAGLTTPREMGSGLYTTLAELVFLLERDDRTDWADVDITRVRDELVAIDLVLREANVVQDRTDGGLAMTITGSETVLAAARTVIGTLSRELEVATGWVSRDIVTQDRIVWRVTDPQGRVVERIQALGFYGLLVRAQDRRRHNWDLARGLVGDGARQAPSAGNPRGWFFDHDDGADRGAGADGDDGVDADGYAWGEAAGRAPPAPPVE